MKDLRSYMIVWLEDHHECETCGYSYAQGYKIYKNDTLVIDKEPAALCFDSANYDHSNAALDILKIEGIQIETVDGENEE